MKTVFADTSFYIALTNARDEHHQVAYRFADEYEGSFVTTAWIITYLANFLRQAPNRPLFLSLHEDLRNDPRMTILPPSSELYERGLELFAKRLDKDWSLTDCISFLVMEQHNLNEAATTDHHFEQAGFKVLLP